MKFNVSIKSRLSGRHLACAEAIDYTNKSIINIGCGNGTFEYLASNVAREIVGVDIKYENILQAKEECQNLRNINFVKADIIEDNFPKNSADVVTMFDVLEHLPKNSEPEVLNKIHKILKLNGQVVISTPLENATKFLDPAWYLHPKHRHYTREQLAELLINSGFRIEKIYTRGGFYEMISMFLFYPFKWILNMEIPFKKWWDKKRLEEYKKDNGCVTLFITAKSSKARPPKRMVSLKPTAKKT